MAAERSARRKKPRPKQAAKQLEITLRRERVAELRLKGLSERAIAKEVGCSLGTVHSDLDAVLEDAQQSAVSYMSRAKVLSLRRLERAIEAIWDAVKSGNLEAVDRLVRIEARRAKVVGFDAADKLEMSGPREEPIKIDARNALLDRLAGLIAGAATGAGAGQDTGKPKPEGG